MAELSTTLPADSIAPAFARKLVEDILARECSADLTLDASLLVSELVTNAVRHAGLTQEDMIGLDLEMAPNYVRVAVTDQGAGFELSPAEPREVGGWGLVLVEHVSNRWGVVRNDPNSVWFELDR